MRTSRTRRQVIISVRSVTQAPAERTFYVGDNLTEEDIKAGFKHGVLTLSFLRRKQAAVGAEEVRYH